MESAPTADLVYQAICTLYHNDNPKEKEKANKWLEEFRKSVSVRLYREFPSQEIFYCFLQHNKNFMNFRYIHGQLPMSCCNRNAICIRATLQLKLCATK